VFQFGYPTTQGRLSDAQGIRRTAEVQMFDHGQETLEIPKLNHKASFMIPFSYCFMK
jgi:hypothetical protein